jgi:Flp pilus assembly protein TadD
VEEEGFWWIMSSKENEAADTVMCCASCGIAAVDNVKLKNCACGLVKYCSVACQKDHRAKHKKMCRKRLAEIRDRDLFEQPDGTHLGDCPICCLPLACDSRKSIMSACCSKIICNGCDDANQKREAQQGMEPKCAFCREELPETQEEHDKITMKRVKKNDPVAMRFLGKKLYDEGDYESALKYWTKAAELGNAYAHFQLGCMYHLGHGVEKDKKKYVYHLEEAAIGGHPYARHNLGCFEAENGRFERAKKHFIIAANLGYNDSLKNVKILYADGLASKEDYADALRGYQAAVDAMKSLERDKAEEAMK